MILLYILIGIILLFLFVFLIKFSVIIEYKTGFSLGVSILGMKIRLLPKKKKKESKQKNDSKKQKSDEGIFEKFNEKIKPLFHLVMRMLDENTIDELRIHALISENDPLRTGVYYGIMKTTIAILKPILDNKSKIRKQSIEILTNFVPSGSVIDFRIVVSSRLYKYMKYIIPLLDIFKEDKKSG